MKWTADVGTFDASPLDVENEQARRDRGGGVRVPPSCFGKFGHSFLRFWEKVSLNLLGFWEKISLNLLRFWEKIALKVSPILGENCPQIFSDFGRKSPSKFLSFSEKIHFKTFFWPFLPFSKIIPSCFHLFAPPLYPTCSIIWTDQKIILKKQNSL